MARINYGFGVRDVSGKIQGTVHSATKYGGIIRSTPKHTTNYSLAQQIQRGRFTAILNLWATLDESQRLAWETFSEYFNDNPDRDKTKRLNGYNVFCELNNNLALFSLTRVLYPPWNGVSQFVESLEFDWTGDWPLIAWKPDINPQLFYPLAYFSPCVSPGVSNVDPYYKLLLPDAYDEPGALYESAYSTRFGGGPLAGRKIFCSLIFVHKISGFIGNELTISEIVPTSKIET